MTRRIAVVTGTRAEYGLLRWVMEAVMAASDLDLTVIATGAHLSPEYGLTYREIERDGFVVHHRVEMLLSGDTPTAVTKSMGLGIIGFADALTAARPDILVVLGDRYEILSAAAAATVLRIPIAHLHGGESTEGAFDEAVRHAITKMAHLHFVAAPEYRHRVLQLGEFPDRVFLVGGLGIDAICRVPLMNREELERSLEFTLLGRNLLVTFHPATLEAEAAVEQMDELLGALDEFPDTRLIFTMPNADPGSRALFSAISAFVQTHPNARAFTSLGQRRYLSCIAHVDGVVGNSSSGLLEVPTFKKGTINIGDRQRGRLRAASVIDCAPSRVAIRGAIAQLYSPEFQAQLATVRNPYGEAGASDRIVEVLRRHPIKDILKKAFYDIAFDIPPERATWSR